MGCGASAHDPKESSVQPVLEREDSDTRASSQPSLLSRVDSDAEGHHTPDVPVQEQTKKIVKKHKVPSIEDYSKGVAVYYLGQWQYRTVSLKFGDRGVVNGPCNNPKLDHANDRVHCSFPDCRVDGLNCIFTRLSLTPICLPEGFEIGKQFFYLSSYSVGGVTANFGDIATVIGPCNDNALEDFDERVTVSFPNIEEVNVHIASLTTERAQMPSGFETGQTVYYNTDFKSDGGRIAFGDCGVVNGPCNNSSLDNFENRVNCSFPNYPNINCFVPRLCFTVPVIPAGFEAGQTVYYLAEFTTDEGKTISRGDKGVVLGACNNAQLGQSEERLLCEFASCGRLNIYAPRLSTEMPEEVAEEKKSYTYVYVKDFTGKTMTFEVCLSESVKHLKSLLEKKERVPIARQHIVFNGTTLDDSQLLGECGLTKGSMLFFLPKAE